MSDSEVIPEATVAVVTPVATAPEQARQYDDNEHEPSPLFDDPNKDYEDRKARRELYFAVALAGVIVAAVIIAVSVVAVGGRPKNTVRQTRQPTQAPTMAPTVAVTASQERLDYVRQQLATANNYTAVFVTELPTTSSQLRSDNTATPMERAIEWAVNRDELVDEKNMMRRLALASVYYQNGGSNWKNTTNWLSTTKSHCEWYGVTCCSDASQFGAPTCHSDDPDSLVNLNLSDNKLKGQVTAVYAQLTDLRSLDLSYNSFTGTLPCPELGSLPKLMSLYLQHNTFTGELDSSLRRNGALQTLFVQRNNFTGAWPTPFCPLCHSCKGNVDQFGLDCDELFCSQDCCRTYTHCYYD